jgi:Zn-dependent protease with chaperone function
MPFLLLLFLMLVCLPDDWPAPVWAATPAECALVTWAGVAAVVGTAFLLARRLSGQLHREPGRRHALLRRYAAWRVYHQVGLYAVYSLTLYAGGWGWAVEQFCGPAAPWRVGTELFLLAPFLTAMILSWACFYDVERAFHQATAGDEAPSSGLDTADAFWGRRAYLGYQVRQRLGLISVPLGLMIVEKGLHRLFPDLQKEQPALTTLLGLAAVVAFVIGMPWLFRLILGLRPLPEGPLRQRLLAAGRRLRFRCSDILLWDTHHGVANAMVIGIHPLLRYVTFSDRLLSDLTPDEIEAVFGHEVGHVKHHHMLYYLGFLVVSLFVVVGAWEAVPLALTGVREWLEGHRHLEVIPFLGLFGAYFFLVFGFLSRRCERQADIYGCKAVSCTRGGCQGHTADAERAAAGRGLCPTGIRTFIEALEKVARLNGISRDRPGWFQSWQHSTIARRVEFLQRMLDDPALEPRFQRRVGLVKWALFLGLAAALGVLGFVRGWDLSWLVL